MQRWIYILTILILTFVSGCSHLNKAKNLITNPTAKDQYKRDYNISTDLFTLWENQGVLALEDSLRVHSPFLLAGHFKPRSFPVYSYNLELKTGEKLYISVETDSTSTLVFLDLYWKENDSLQTFTKISSSGFQSDTLTKEIEESGTYKIAIQPEIEASTPFRIKIKTTPVYQFPIAGGENRNIQSFWGAARDGGRRSHEGVDIFAPRGTPVIAVTDGRISSSGEKGLGGKQVWLRDPKRGQSLYYAHLDSIAPLGNTRVKTGDTIGFVGNTGNAKTTAPHLHFGIYKGYGGAIDPLPHVFQIIEPEFNMPDAIPQTLNLITKSRGNLRAEPTTENTKIIGSFPASDTVVFLGKTDDWFHIRTPGSKAAFIHESLVDPL